MKILKIVLLALLCITYELRFVSGHCKAHDEVQYECAHTCPPSCFHLVPKCKLPCRKGCMCKPGYYYNQFKRCVPYDDCYTGIKEETVMDEYYGCPHLNSEGKRCLIQCNTKDVDYTVLRVTCYKQCCSRFARSKSVMANKCYKK